MDYKGIHVLLCEHEEVMVTAIEFRLKKQGIDVRVVKDGATAAEYLQSNNPDLMIVNADLPGKNGIEMLEYLRKDLGRLTPFIFIADIEDLSTVPEAFQNGADDFITKPFKPSELILRIGHLLNKFVPS